MHTGLLFSVQLLAVSVSCCFLESQAALQTVWHVPHASNAKALNVMQEVTKLGHKVEPQKLHSSPSGMSQAPWWGTALPAAFQAPQLQPLPPRVRFWRHMEHSHYGLLLCWPGLGNITGRREKMVSVSFHVSQDSVVVLIIVLSTGNFLESGLKLLTQSHCRHWHQSRVEIQGQIKVRF